MNEISRPSRKYKDDFARRVALALLSTLSDHSIRTKEYEFDDTNLSELKFKFAVPALTHARIDKKHIGRPISQFLPSLIKKVESFNGEFRITPSYNVIFIEITIPRPSTEPL